ncbi:hypothetical protein [Oceanobacillus sp. FSL H7-0719]|uniref:hypothetical protein n=1 Tax=Oceanobacillus sp. FSL H7-0719 TaxID=2954507 RepID=UPI003254779D
MSLKEINQPPIVQVYEEVFSGFRKTLPKGTWQKDENVIILIRYVLEIKLSLTKLEIPRISKQTIQDQKLWGALNRFKSIKRLLNFVYPGEFNEFSYERVPVNYWANTENIKLKFEEILQKEKLPIAEIPQFITYDLLVEWGFSNPLKRHNHSPYELVNAMYPNVFSPFEFRKTPHKYARDNMHLREQFLNMLQSEGIAFQETPRKVTQETLNKYKFSGTMQVYKNSPATFIQSLFHNEFKIEDFNKPQRHWHNVESVKKEISRIMEELGIPFAELPQHLTKKKYMERGLGGLLDYYDGSPIKILQACYPEEFDIIEFKRLPNRYWYNKNNRTHALRAFCKKYNIQHEKISLLSRTYLKANAPRLVSVLDRHFESKIHMWIIEAFPDWKLKPKDFNLLIGNDGQLCDSQEELFVHNKLLEVFKSANIQREGKRLINELYNETYIPDWIIVENDSLKVIIEYFGLYGSSKFAGYTERADRKITYYKTLKGYRFIAIFPEDLGRLDSILV